LFRCFLFANLFGDEPKDGYLPEEWIASAVKALNKGSTNPKEGLSKVKNSDLFFDELLEKNPDELLGKGNKFRILVKGLDSAIRLPAQAHPHKAFSRKHFAWHYGKTECWLILATRENAKLYFGFKVIESHSKAFALRYFVRRNGKKYEKENYIYNSAPPYALAYVCRMLGRGRRVGRRE
jgi:mannose-6-phosphate isomerase class I